MWGLLNTILSFRLQCGVLQVRKPKRRVITPASASTTINNIVCLNSSQQPQLHWAEFGYLLDKIAAAAAAARKKGKTQLQQQQMELPPGLQRSVPEVVPVMDWQDAAAAEQREQEALMADDADAGGAMTISGGCHQRLRQLHTSCRSP